MQVAFTPLEFPHLPARAQREEELKLYKQKQRDAASFTDSLDISDRQPVFLKDKGDALFAQRNYAAAVNAFSAALDGEESGTTLALTCWYELSWYTLLHFVAQGCLLLYAVCAASAIEL